MLPTKAYKPKSILIDWYIYYMRLIKKYSKKKNHMICSGGSEKLNISQSSN